MRQAEISPDVNVLSARRPRGNVRWVICALLFAATTINYIDRQVIGVLKPILTDQFHWTQIDYGNIVFAFQTAYAIGLISMGYVLDRLGVRVGFALAVALWSAASAAHGLANHLKLDSGIAQSSFIVSVGGISVAAFAAARFALGIAEAGNFPAAIKTVAEWFPKQERSLCIGIFNAGSSIGPIATPLAAPWIIHHWGWPAAFYVTGALGLLWVIAWLALYSNPAQHPSVTTEELDYIRSGAEPPQPKIPWIDLLGHRQTWGIAAAKFLTDPIWWFYLFWVPDFLHTQYKLDITSFGPPLVVIYLMTDVGSISGGWLSSTLIKRGFTTNFSRKIAMLICAICVLPILGAAHVTNQWTAVLLIGLAASAHQGWSCNIFSLVSDTVPKQAVSSVTGIAGTAGAIGGMCIAKLVGYVLQHSHNSYIIPFAIAGCSYLVALLVVQLLMPRLEPMRIGADAGRGFEVRSSDAPRE